MVTLAMALAIAIAVAISVAVAVAVTLAVGPCGLRHRRPLQLPSPLAITVAMLLAISESCCLGAEKMYSTN